jgi:hypothetical protein
MPATADEQTKILALDVQVAKINTNLRYLIGIGVFLAGAVVSGLWHSYEAVRLITRIEDGVIVLQRDFTEIKADFKEMRKDTAELRADFKSQAGQLDRIEKALAQNPPNRPKPTP